MTIGYSELSSQRDARPCRLCGAETAPGAPGHSGSQQHFESYLCERHQERFAELDEAPCIDCVTEIAYLCGACLGHEPQVEPDQEIVLSELLDDEPRGPVH